MSEIEFRAGEKRFSDSKGFPRGFSKSGDFTILEDELLTTYGQTMLDLEQGILDPENSEEKHFLKVVKNPGKAKSKLERVWVKYTKLARGRRSFHTLNSRNHYSQSQSLVDIPEEIEDDEPVF